MRKKSKDSWAQLVDLISAYRDAAIAESWKGGGDPTEADVIDARLALARIELSVHMHKMKREFGV